MCDDDDDDVYRIYSNRMKKKKMLLRIFQHKLQGIKDLQCTDECVKRWESAACCCQLAVLIIANYCKG